MIARSTLVLPEPDGRTRLLHHAGVHLAAAQRLEQVGADRGEACPRRVGAGALHQEQHQHMVGVAEAGDADGAALKRLGVGDLGGGARRGRQREERQPAGLGEAADRGAIGEGLQRDIEGGAGVVHRPAGQGLHRLVAPADIDQLDLHALVAEMAACLRHLIGYDAEELTAEGEAKPGRTLRIGRPAARAKGPLPSRQGF